MPAYAKDGKVLCFFQAAEKFGARYATPGFNDVATLDDGTMWPTAFALAALTPENKARIGTCCGRPWADMPRLRLAGLGHAGDAYSGVQRSWAAGNPLVSRARRETSFTGARDEVSRLRSRHGLVAAGQVFCNTL
ncbi:MAG: hypothetical protein R2853_17300 [Thermomicrobiales bacterium]